ncbi:hypothetical protein D3C81_1554630 [compost metagenome]
MARQFIIKAKALPFMPDLHHAAGKRNPCQRLWCFRQRIQRIGIGRFKRISRKQMQDIRHHQFLMLLFMLQAQFQQVHDFGQHLLRH